MHFKLQRALYRTGRAALCTSRKNGNRKAFLTLDAELCQSEFGTRNIEARVSAAFHSNDYHYIHDLVVHYEQKIK